MTRRDTREPAISPSPSFPHSLSLCVSHLSVQGGNTKWTRSKKVFANIEKNLQEKLNQAEPPS